jgi:trimeric autotransporter adhesin
LNHPIEVLQRLVLQTNFKFYLDPFQTKYKQIKMKLMKMLHMLMVTGAICVTVIAGAQTGLTQYGFEALLNNTTGDYNSAFGYQSLRSNTIGTNNTAFGYGSSYTNSTGNNNTAIGYSALYNNTGAGNTATGNVSLYRNTSGSLNTANGNGALYGNLTGSNNTGIGNSALYSNTSGSYNTAIGYLALTDNLNSNYNTATGALSLYQNETGSENTANGYGVLYTNFTTSGNTGMGYNALHANTGSYNTAIGSYAQEANTTASYNTSIGRRSLANNTTGQRNTAVGYNTLSVNITGNNNTVIGYSANASAGNLSNATAIGYNTVVDASNKVRIGNSNITSIGGQVGWTVFSDGRFKTNVKENVSGLEFIKALRPVTYTLNVKGINAKLNAANNPSDDANAKSADAEMDNATDAAAKIIYSGFIAQEVQAVAEKLNYDFSGVDKPQTKDGMYGLRYDNFIVPLVKAVQELSKKNDEKDDIIIQLTERVSRLEQSAKSNSNASALTSDLQKAINNTGASLEQNVPNSFNSSTTIGYNIPASVNKAQIIVTNAAGNAVKIFTLNKGASSINIQANELSAGSYYYTLIVDGKKVDSKKMILVK